MAAACSTASLECRSCSGSLHRLRHLRDLLGHLEIEHEARHDREQRATEEQHAPPEAWTGECARDLTRPLLERLQAADRALERASHALDGASHATGGGLERTRHPLHRGADLVCAWERRADCCVRPTCEESAGQKVSPGVVPASLTCARSLVVARPGAPPARTELGKG